MFVKKKQGLACHTFVLTLLFVFVSIIAIFIKPWASINVYSIEQTLRDDQHHHSHQHDIIYNIKRNISVTIVTLIGVEGSGHHLFESILFRMHKHSQHHNNITMVNTDYMHLGKCREIQTKHLDEMNAIILRNDSIDIHHFLFAVTGQLSYPCGEKPRKYPNMTRLMQLVEHYNAQQNVIPFDLKFIVLQRNLVECLVSTCIHRSRKGGCNDSLSHQHRGAMLIEQELKNIPQKYWIMINYHDFVRNSTNYMKIISEWLNVADMNLMKLSFASIKASKGTNRSIQNAWNEIYEWDQTHNASFNLTQSVVNNLELIKRNEKFTS